MWVQVPFPAAYERVAARVAALFFPCLMKQFAVSPGREEVSSLLLAPPDLSQQGGQRRIQWNGEMTGWFADRGAVRLEFISANQYNEEQGFKSVRRWQEK